jgi:hypothetical protein
MRAGATVAALLAREFEIRQVQTYWHGSLALLVKRATPEPG